MTGHDEAWHAERRDGIGGSDAPMLAGVSPFGGPLDVYLAKTEPRNGEKPDPDGVLLRGQVLEGAVRDWYSRVTGRKVHRRRLVRHPEHREMIGHIDGRVVGEPRILEVKTTTRRLSDVPADWTVQVQHYLAVTGAEVCDIAALGPSLQLDIYEMPRDEALIADLVEMEHIFWTQHVLARVPPPIDGSEGARRWLNARFPADDGHEMVADEQLSGWVHALLDAKDAEKALGADIALLENQLKEAMGEAATLAGSDFRVSWRRSNDQTVVDWEAVAREIGPAADLLARHTTTKPGVRRFLPRRLT